MTHHKFAKLFETAIGQILVVRQRGEDSNGKESPQLTITFDSGVDGLEPIVGTTSFTDSDKGIKARDALFDGMTEQNLVDYVRDQRKVLLQLFDRAGELK